MRSAPPTLPGTPIRPSMPPRSFLAQKVTIPPRSAAASTVAVLPSMLMPSFEVGRCNATQESSPSSMSTFEPPHDFRNGFEFAQDQQVGGAPDAERSFFGHGHTSRQFDAECGELGGDRL